MDTDIIKPFKEDVNESLSIPNASLIDDYAAKKTEQYPDGNNEYLVQKDPKSLDKKKTVMPLIHWSKSVVNSWSRLYKCNGIYICTLCNFREKPQVPRGGNNEVPPSKRKFCIQHKNTELLYVACTTKWTVSDANTHWKMNHIGVHNHRAPPPTKAHFQSLQKLEDMKRVAPELTSAQLTFGHIRYTS